MRLPNAAKVRILVAAGVLWLTGFFTVVASLVR